MGEKERQLLRIKKLLKMKVNNVFSIKITYADDCKHLLIRKVKLHQYLSRLGEAGALIYTK